MDLMEKTKRIQKKKMKISLDLLKMLFLLAYFLILTVERIISLCVVFTGDFSTYNALDYYMTAMTVLSLVGAYVFLAVKGKSALFKGKDGKRSLVPISSPDNYKILSVSAGILLVSGMLHTHGSIPPVQFASYGFILASMAIHTAQNAKKAGYADRKWLSFAYIVSYSMAIPVVYHTNIDLAFLFIPIEIVVSLGMVTMFTLMLVTFYSENAECGFSHLPFLVALFGDALVLSMRWHEEINYMVLIFICATTILWFTGTVLGINSENKNK